MTHPVPDDTTDPDRASWLRDDGVASDDVPAFDDADRRVWPRRWNLADGYDLDDFELRGATHTIAEFVAALTEGPAAATLHVGFEQQSGSIVSVFDGDHRLIVQLAPDAQPIGSGRVWEIDVEGDHDPDLRPYEPPPIPEIPPWDESIREDPERLSAYVRSVARRSRIETPPAAVVTIARPIDVDAVLGSTDESAAADQGGEPADGDDG